MHRLYAAAAAAVLALVCAACGTTGATSGATAAAKAAVTAVQDSAAIRAGVEQGVAGTASAIAVAAPLGVVDPNKLKSLRTDLTTACSSLQIGRALFAATGAPSSDALTRAEAAADDACAKADRALAAAGG